MKDYIFIDSDIETLKSEIKDTKKEVYVRLVNQCETYFDVELSKEHPKASSTYMGIAMANLSLAYLLSEDKRYFEEAKRWMFTTVGYAHWGNAHLVDVDLSAAWILFGLGLCYDWLRDDLTDDERVAVKDKLILQGTRMYTFKVETEGKGWSTNFWQNHNWINMTGLAAAGYALVDEEASVQDWITSSKENFDIVYDIMADDGSDYEGVVYWRYGAMWLFVYAHLVKERESIDHFKTCGFLQNTFDYRLYQAAPNLEEQMNFGDAHDRISGHSTAIYYKTAAEYKNGYAQKMGNLVRDEFLLKEAQSKVKPGILPECFFEMLFFDPSVEPKEFSDLPLTRYFDDLGLFVQRSSWERDATLLTFKCSTPGGKKQWDLLWKFKEEKNYNCFGLSHQHPDNNSFLIHTGGEYLAIDDGYNRTVKASDHNTILVDGEGYEDEGQNNIWKNYTKDMTAEVEQCLIEDGLNYVVGETAKVYKKEFKLNSFKRHLINAGQPYYVMIDELESDLEHIYSWQMYSDVHPVIEGSKAHFDVNGAKSDFYIFSDVETETTMKENVVRAVMTTQEPDKFTENHMKGVICSNKVKTKNHSFVSVFVPLSETGSDITVEKVELDNAYGVIVSYAGFQKAYVFAKDGKTSYKGNSISSKVSVINIEDNEVTEVKELNK